MTIIAVQLDDRTERDLQALCRTEGQDASTVAARLLARVIHSARARRVFNSSELKPLYDLFADDDVGMADSGQHDRADLLLQDDRE